MPENCARDDELLDKLLDGDLGELGLAAADLDPSRRRALERLVGLVGPPLADGERELPPPLSTDDLDQAGFRIVGLLGSGAHSVVYDAEDLALGRHVALKVVHAGWNDETAQKTFLREARTLAKIDHPNVLRIWSAARHRGLLLLALERIEGQTLREAVAEKGPLSCREAARVARDVARALTAVHRERILHRDINPNNVMLERGGRTLLLDFSVARLEESEQLRRGGTLGSPVYEAPEVLEGGAPTERSEIYALGILLVWLCSGSSPFEGLTWGELRQNALAGKHLPLAQVCPAMPKGLRRIVERALRREPAQRTHDARTMARELDRFLWRPRKIAAACAGALALAAVGLGLWLERGRVAVSAEKEAELTARISSMMEDAGRRTLALDTLSEFRLLDTPRGLEDLIEPRRDPAEGLGFEGRRLRVPGDHETIAEAVAAARDGDVVLLGPKVWRECVEIANLSIALVGVEGAARTVIDADGADKPVVLVDTLDQLGAAPASIRVVIRGIGVTGGLGRGTPAAHEVDWYGGGIAGSGRALDLLVEECVVWNNGRRGTTFGGGILLKGGGGGRLVVRRCLIAGNGAWACGGGILVDGGSALVERCTVVRNFSDDFGGVQGGIGIANGGWVDVVASVLEGNAGEQIGGFQEFDDGVGWNWTPPSQPPRFRDDARSDWRLASVAPSDLGAFRWSEPSGAVPSPGSVDGQDRWLYLLGVVPAGVEGLGAPDQDELAGAKSVVRVPEDFDTIQDAVDAAPRDATIVLAAGHYREALRLPARSMRIVGKEGAGATVIDSGRLRGATVDVEVRSNAAGARPRIRLRGLTLHGGLGRFLLGKGPQGGALAVSGPVSVALEGCVIWRSGNAEQTYAGGALWVGPPATVSLVDCLVANNRVFGMAGAALVEGGALDLEHCTLTENRSRSLDLDIQSAIALAAGGRLELRESILWGDAGAEILILGEGCEVNAARSIVQGGFSGHDVLDEDPGFADPSRSDWRRGIPPVDGRIETPSSAVPGAGSWGFSGRR